jgi:hypothetical protein
MNIKWKEWYGEAIVAYCDQILVYDEITAKPPSEGLVCLFCSRGSNTFRTRVRRVTVAPAHYVEDTILGFDFITKYHFETASRLDSVVICYGWLPGLVI